MSEFFESPPNDQEGRRRTRTVVFHVVIAYVAFGLALLAGGTVAIVLTGITAAIATVTLVRFWAKG